MQRRSPTRRQLIATLICVVFHNFLKSKCEGLPTFKDLSRLLLSDNEVETYLEIFCLLYADDSIILSESAAGLQTTLNASMEYATMWKLKINFKKTKALVFSRGKIRNKPILFMGGQPIEVVDDFCYLGVIFNYNGKFGKAIAHNINKAKKAVFGLKNIVYKCGIDLSTTIDLFHKMVTPIRTYGSEVWGVANNKVIDTLFYKYCN